MATKKPLAKPKKTIINTKHMTVSQRVEKIEKWITDYFPEEIKMIWEEISCLKRPAPFITTNNCSDGTRVSMQVSPRNRKKDIPDTSGYMTIV
jgi:hypothetical protein